MTRLSVNVNKIATLRNARGENTPDLILFTRRCEEYGAQGITVHPRPDERHIRRDDVAEIKKIVTTEFNIEGYPTEEFLQLVLRTCPDQVTLVPDKPDQLTSDSGWDVPANEDFLGKVIRRLKDKGIRVSIFVSPETEQVKKAAELGADRVELYTKPYADNYDADRDKAIMPYILASQAAIEAGIGVNAGHDLNLHNLAFLKNTLPRLDEVSIGHALISDALYYGLRETIRLYLEKLS